MRIKKTSETRALAGNIVNAYSESQNSAYASKYCNEAFGGTILWTNPSPTSDFASQTVNLSSSDYDFYEIIYIEGTGTLSSVAISSGKTPKGKNTILDFIVGLESGANMQYRWREVAYNTDTKLDFAGGISKAFNATTLIQRNDNAIPLYVIGYKTGLFN